MKSPAAIAGTEADAGGAELELDELLQAPSPTPSMRTAVAAANDLNDLFIDAPSPRPDRSPSATAGPAATSSYGADTPLRFLVRRSLYTGADISHFERPPVRSRTTSSYPSRRSRIGSFGPEGSGPSPNDPEPAAAVPSRRMSGAARSSRSSRSIALVLALAAAFLGVTVAAAPAAPTLPAEHTCVGGTARCGSVAVPLDRAHPALGTLHIGYERYPHRNTALSPLEPIVAIEGGPGYPTTLSRDYYLPLFRPLMDRHDLLLVDLRGTGTSGVINCAFLQSLTVAQYATEWVKGVRRCGHQLGRASDLYGTADAADDLADVLDALGVSRVDLYGDSYGTFFSQVFAIRHPARLRTLVLDATYPVEHWDPWWRDLARAARTGYRLACDRDPGCVAVGGDPVRRLAALDRLVAKHPITGVAPNADGVMAKVTIDPSALISIFGAGGYLFGPYRELDAAVRAALRPHPDDLPLLRIAREQLEPGNFGPVTGVLGRTGRRGRVHGLPAALRHDGAAGRPPHGSTTGRWRACDARTRTRSRPSRSPSSSIRRTRTSTPASAGPSRTSRSRCCRRGTSTRTCRRWSWSATSTPSRRPKAPAAWRTASRTPRSSRCRT